MTHFNKVKKETLSKEVQLEIESVAKSKGKHENTYVHEIYYSRFPLKEFLTFPNVEDGDYESSFKLELNEHYSLNCKIVDKTTISIPVIKGYFGRDLTSFILEKKDKTKPAFCFAENIIHSEGYEERIIVIEF